MNEVAETTSEESQVATESVSTGFIGDDGNFTENWMETAGIHEDLRSNLTLKSTKNVASMASQLVNAQQMIGKSGNMVVIPDENSSQVEWDNYYDQTRGVDTAGDYTIAHDEALGAVDETMEAAFKDLAYSEGLRNSTVQKLIAMDDQRMLAMREAMETQTANEKAAAEETLKKEWGGAYDQRLHLANRMIEENVNDANKDAVLKAVGNDPRVADFLANMAKKFVEHKVIDADVSQQTPNDAMAEIETLRSTPGYVTGELAKTSPARHKQITEQLGMLYKKAYPGK